ncbi:Nin one binding Zn-ribbon like-domain-containing protein [Sphaerosporella brunnea]|uniref:20S-pre-rRNA D-site endonuclease NOB1 n=1 Tax=Sphaerosporella brunnea TaxID=1250544 RepID=A0A5J5F3U2_9PEZI|nr:Nin one binding Zn-ribbon like-domain-containing protein [Sphaerosporella brunnea]
MSLAGADAAAVPVLNSSDKRIDTLVVDAGPILSSASTPSFYLASADRIFTTPAVISEIRDEAARSRFETLWKPFVNVRSPRAESLKVVAEFAKKTGDFGVLSATDLGLIALGYELELEVAGGDWRLRKVPGQEALNGPLPEGWGWDGKKKTQNTEGSGDEIRKSSPEEAAAVSIATQLDNVSLEDEEAQGIEEEDESEDDDSEGWITPSNLHRHVQSAPSQMESPDDEKLTVALATTDFAMQNTLLQLNLHLLSPSSLARIKSVRSTVLRCHGCFYVIRRPTSTSHFCPRCGAGDTLRRVGCSTDSNGVFRLHLKKNFQHNVRGNVFSLPKPVAGTCSMKGVPDAPVLREDQKEYQRAVKWESYRKEKDLLDPDALPGILTGTRRRGSAIRVGAGRGKNPNEVKRGKSKKK